MNSKQAATILIGILILAAMLRFYKLASFPVGFHIDEASLGYNGYSLLKTGKDEHGNAFPLYIDMFGDYRPSGYHYLTIVPIAIFGLNEFATRFPGAFFGTISVIALYYLSLSIFGDRKIALLSSLFLAISPWHVGLSRASAETIVALFFIILGFALVIRSLLHKTILYLLVGTCSLGISFFFYHTPRVFVPLLLICIIVLFVNRIRASDRKYRYIFIIACFGLFLLSSLLIFVAKGGAERFSQVSIFGFPETKLVMEEQFREDGTQNVNLIVVRMFHNKLINYSLTFISNYFDYFTGKFLFINGGLPEWYKIQSIGLIYLAELPLIVYGFVHMWTQKKLFKVPLVWLFIAPMVAAATTDDIPNIQRSVVMFPSLEIIAGYGFIKLITVHTKRYTYILSFIFCLALGINFIFFLHQYYVHGKTHKTLYRNNGFKEMVNIIKDNYNRYDKFIITKTLGGIYPSVLFFMNYDPEKYQEEGSPKDKDFGGFGKFIFTPQSCPSIEGGDKYPKNRHIVYINNGTCKISPLGKQERVFREDGTLAFIIVYPKE